MQTKENNRGKPSGPKDRSLEAYKTWMIEIARRLTTQKTMIQLTEGDWRKSWRKYWQQNSRR